MRRVNVTPMMNTLSGVRRTLINDLSEENQASKSTSLSSSSPDPNLLSHNLSQRALSPPEACPPTNASAMSPPGACTKIKQAVETAQVKQAVVTEIADQSQTPPSELPAKQEEYNPSIAAGLSADQEKLHSLESKVNHFSTAHSEQGTAANQTAAELSLQCDRIRFDLDQSQQSQTIALQTCMQKMQGTMDAQRQATVQLQKNMEGLFIVMSDMKQSFQSSNVLPTATAAATANTETPPLMREETFEENPEATEALLLAQSFLLSGIESIDQKTFCSVQYCCRRSVYLFQAQRKVCGCQILH